MTIFNDSTETQLDECAERMYEQLHRKLETAHGGDFVPQAWRAEVYRRIAVKTLSFADYLENKS